VPQAPQFIGSVCEFTHAPEHTRMGAAQPQSPATHETPAMQTFPQRPQLRLSVRVSTQAPLHSVEPAVQPASRPESSPGVTTSAPSTPAAASRGTSGRASNVAGGSPQPTAAAAKTHNASENRTLGTSRWQFTIGSPLAPARIECDRSVAENSACGHGGCAPWCHAVDWRSMEDTQPSAFHRYHDLLRAQAPHERLAQSVALTRMVRGLAVAGIRDRHPNATDDEVRVRLAVRLYGRDAARRMFEAIPLDAV